MSSVYERATAIVAVLGLAIAVGGSWVDSQTNQTEFSARVFNVEKRLGALEELPKEVTKLQSQMDTIKSTNERALEVFGKLSDAIDRLSISVARLDERMKQIEKKED